MWSWLSVWWHFFFIFFLFLLSISSPLLKVYLRKNIWLSDIGSQSSTVKWKEWNLMFFFFSSSSSSHFLSFVFNSFRWPAYHHIVCVCVQMHWKICWKWSLFDDIIFITLLYSCDWFIHRIWLKLLPALRQCSNYFITGQDNSNKN